jgi:hypothetical protein
MAFLGRTFLICTAFLNWLGVGARHPRWANPRWQSYSLFPFACGQSCQHPAYVFADPEKGNLQTTLGRFDDAMNTASTELIVIHELTKALVHFVYIVVAIYL